MLSRVRALRSGHVFVALCLLGLAIGARSLTYEWNWDDLHLMRSYSASELRSAIVGSWDPDGIETFGWRPGTTLFNAMRYRLFGEAVVLHRLFLLCLYAAALTLLAATAARLGTSRITAMVAVVLAMSAKNSYYHYLWISDGVHALQLFLIAIAFWHAVRYADHARKIDLLLTLGAAALALATREDSIAAFPLIAGGALLKSRLHGRTSRIALGLGVLSVAGWMVRTLASPGAPAVALDMSWLQNLGRMLYWTTALGGGQDESRWPFVLTAIAAAVMVVRLRADRRARAAYWLVAAVLACAVGSFGARPNLLVIAGTCYGFFFAEVLDGIWHFGGLSRLVAASIAIVACGAAIRASVLEQPSMHPMSAEQLYRNWQVVHGPLSAATVPAAREEQVRKRLKAADLDDVEVDFPSWEEDLRRLGRTARAEDGQPFVPSRRFLEHTFFDIDATVPLAISQGATREFGPISIDRDGSSRHGVVFDRFRMIARRAWMAMAAGRPMPRGTSVDELGIFGLVVFAYPLTCNGRVLVPVSVALRSATGQYERVCNGDGPNTSTATLVPRFKPPAHSLSAVFARTALRPGDVFEIKYVSAGCDGAGEGEDLPVAFEPARPLQTDPPRIPDGVRLGEPVIRFQTVVDVDGRFQDPIRRSGPDVLVPPAQAALRSWRAAPARVNGSAVPVESLAVVRFRR